MDTKNTNNGGDYSSDINNPDIVEGMEEHKIVAKEEKPVNIKGTDSDVVMSKKTGDLSLIKCVPIGIGAGGSNVAVKIAEYINDFKKPNNKCIIINTSQVDLTSIESVSPEMKFKIGSIEGTGAVRENAKEIMRGSENIDYYQLFFDKYKGMLFNDNCIIPVVFSTSGGSGSGAAPMFLTKLLTSIQQYEGTVKKKVDGEIKDVPVTDFKRPRVIAVAILPSLTSDSEGQKALQNTINCISELNSLIEGGYLSVLLVSNDKTSFEQSDISKVYSDINTKIAKFFYRFCNIFSLSDFKSLDINDRLRSIETPGVMSVTSYDDEFESPFVLPTDCVYGKMIAELNQEESNEATKKLSDYLSTLNIAYSSPRIGYMKEQILPNTEAAKSLTPKDYGPIIILSGLSTVNKVISPYITRLKQIMLKKDSVDKTLKSQNELNRLGDTNEKLNSSDKAKKIDIDLSSII